jgi:hypothetical protein
MTVIRTPAPPTTFTDLRAEARRAVSLLYFAADPKRVNENDIHELYETVMDYIDRIEVVEVKGVNVDFTTASWEEE